MDEKKFKVFFFDIGIAHRILGLDLAEWVTHPLEVKLFGFSAEQLVAQELISYSDPSQKGELYYWQNESISSNAEVDFITIHNKKITPIEVKSKIKGGMFGKQSHLLEIPLYGVKNI